ncbi:cation diffusion facilitator family transporter [Clostridium uliginosum]|uniref:Cation diffusion facilitator family transporter n=1 Tax=Clostridium uliginosum TaxID=119641 RepID=A0A1I1NR07_9CLOT|nr:cation diffusion facilitator family transporter [Clostridium uliginosum]SFD00091.1 cation diffusion facilitator family transporter [Clostridium uliginosum]
MIKNNFMEVKKVLWIIMFANIAVAVAKIIMGTIINSSSMTADGFHSITDGSSNIIGLIGIGIASKPIDDDHPYGHRKYETLTGLFIVGMLVFLGFKIIADSVTKFMNPVMPEINIVSFIVMIITLCINIFVTKYEHKKGVELNSTILISDAMHTKSDIYVTLGVITTLVAIKLGAPPIVDSLASFIVAIFILRAAYDIFKVSSSILVDSAAVDTENVEKIVLTQEGVKGVHKIRSRGTIDDMHIDMHILADSDLSLEESHKLNHKIQDAIRKELNNNVEVIVHLEPYEEDTVKTED